MDQSPQSTQPASLETPQPKTESFPPPEHPTPRFLSKKIAIITIILILIIFSVLGVFAAMNLQKPPQSKPVSSSITPTTNPTANWKTYRDNTFGFEIQYPPHLSPVTSSAPRVKSITILEENLQGMGVNIWVLDNSQGVSLSTAQNGYPIFKAESGEIGYDSGSGIITFFINDAEQVQLFCRGGDNISHQSTLNNDSCSKIFSTFKFTDQKRDNSGWKTYTDEKNGFSMSYPGDWFFDERSGKDTMDIHLSTKKNLTDDSTYCPDDYIGLGIQIRKYEPQSYEEFLQNQNRSFESFVKDHINTSSSYDPSGKLENILINGQAAFKVEKSNGYGCAGPGYFIERNKDTYINVSSSIHDAPDGIKTIEKILSTFKLTD